MTKHTDAQESGNGLLDAFSELTDPRCRECQYALDELLLVAIFAITSGAEGWIALVAWGQAKQEWLRKFLPFHHGIASHDTFNRLFSRLNANVFEACFIKWMGQLCPELAGQHLAVDGKSVRRSHDGTQRMASMRLPSKSSRKRRITCWASKTTSQRWQKGCDNGLRRPNQANWIAPSGRTSCQQRKIMADSRRVVVLSLTTSLGWRKQGSIGRDCKAL